MSGDNNYHDATSPDIYTVIFLAVLSWDEIELNICIRGSLRRLLLDRISFVFLGLDVYLSGNR